MNEHDQSQWFDRFFAATCILFLSPLLLVRAIIGLVKCGSVFEKTEVSSPDGEFNLLRFSGFIRGRKLAFLFNIVANDIVLVGQGTLVSEVVARNRYADGANAEPVHAKPCLVNLNKVQDKSGTCYEEHNVAVLTNRNKISIMARYALISLMVPNKRFSRPDKFQMLGTSVDNLTLDGAIELVVNSATSKSKTRLAFVNADCLNIAVKNDEYRDALNNMSRIFADGIGMQIGAQMLGVDLKENVNGTDMLPKICKASIENNLSLYLLGGKPGVADEAVANLSSEFPGLNVVGTRHGYFSQDEEVDVVDAINESEADILLVAFGAPLQELWIDRLSSNLNPSIQVGVGGLFDFYTDRISRSPKWVQDIGLEWIWRLKQEPLRLWKRYLVGNPLFLYRMHKQSKNDQHCANFRRFSNPHKAMSSPNKRYRRKQNRWLFKIYLQRVGKRLTDITASAIALLCLSPVLIIVAVLIKLESKGDILFRQKRVGRYGKEFSMLKFRSMRSDAESIKSELAADNEVDGGVTFKMKADPRVTRVGRFIRRYSIDELPQLINVLKGEMSLVGPRPPVPKEVDLYGSLDRRRLEVIPGITGLWQVSGRSDTTFEEQVALDIDYLESNGLMQDFLILIKTVPAVLSGKGAY